jgi:hypothetical protein
VERTRTGRFRLIEFNLGVGIGRSPGEAGDDERKSRHLGNTQHCSFSPKLFAKAIILFYWLEAGIPGRLSPIRRLSGFHGIRVFIALRLDIATVRFANAATRFFHATVEMTCLSILDMFL